MVRKKTVAASNYVAPEDFVLAVEAPNVAENVKVVIVDVRNIQKKKVVAAVNAEIPH